MEYPMIFDYLVVLFKYSFSSIPMNSIGFTNEYFVINWSFKFCKNIGLYTKDQDLIFHAHHQMVLCYW